MWHSELSGRHKHMVHTRLWFERCERREWITSASWLSCLDSSCIVKDRLALTFLALLLISSVLIYIIDRIVLARQASLNSLAFIWLVASGLLELQASGCLQFTRIVCTWLQAVHSSCMLLDAGSSFELRARDCMQIVGCFGIDSEVWLFWVSSASGCVVRNGRRKIIVLCATQLGAEWDLFGGCA